MSFCWDGCFTWFTAYILTPSVWYPHFLFIFILFSSLVAENVLSLVQRCTVPGMCFALRTSFCVCSTFPRICCNSQLSFGAPIAILPVTPQGKCSWCWIRLLNDVKKKLTAVQICHTSPHTCPAVSAQRWETYLANKATAEPEEGEEWHTTCEFLLVRPRGPLCRHSYIHFYYLVYFGLWRVQMQETLTYVGCHALPLELLDSGVTLMFGFYMTPPPCYLSSQFLLFSRGVQTLKFLLLPIPRRQFGAK